MQRKRRRNRPKFKGYQVRHWTRQSPDVTITKLRSSVELRILGGCQRAFLALRQTVAVAILIAYYELFRLSGLAAKLDAALPRQARASEEHILQQTSTTPANDASRKQRGSSGRESEVRISCPICRIVTDVAETEPCHASHRYIQQTAKLSSAREEGRL